MNGMSLLWNFPGIYALELVARKPQIARSRVEDDIEELLSKVERDGISGTSFDCSQGRCIRVDPLRDKSYKILSAISSNDCIDDIPLELGG